MSKRHFREMTVAHIREHKGADYVEVMFLESARFYKLTTKNDRALRILQDALANRRSLNVGLASLESNIIEEIQERDEGHA